MNLVHPDAVDPVAVKLLANRWRARTLPFASIAMTLKSILAASTASFPASSIATTMVEPGDEASGAGTAATRIVNPRV